MGKCFADNIVQGISSPFNAENSVQFIGLDCALSSIRVIFVENQIQMPLKDGDACASKLWSISQALTEIHALR